MEELEITEVKKSQIENFSDLSSEFYKKEYINKNNFLDKMSSISISDFSYVTDGEHGSPDWDENSNINYITAEYIKPNYILDRNYDKISLKQHIKNSRASLRKNDVLYQFK